MGRPVTWAAAALAVLTAVRLWIAAVVPLAPDEAYYWTWSRALAAGYVDHPPMVALWIRAGTALAGAGTIGVRLLGPLSAALGSLLLFDTAQRLFGEHPVGGGRWTRPGAGLTAAALMNATLILGVGAIIMTPDAPLLLFWTGALWTGARLATGGTPWWWLAAGMFTGLALSSKYTAAFLPIGFGLYALIAAPRSLRRKEPWLGALSALLIFFPVVLWNARNEWAGFLRQGGRVADWRPERAAGFLAELVFGQIGLATPGVFILFAAGIVLAVRAATRSRDPAWTLLAAFSVPPALVFLQHAVGDRVQGNWPAVLYPAAAVAASGLTSFGVTSPGLTSPVWRRLIWPSACLGFAVTAAVYVHAVTGWPVVAVGRDPLARQLFGWDELAARVEAARLDSGASFVVAEPFGLASELAWALPRTVVVNADARLGSAQPTPERTASGRGLLIRPERYGGTPGGAWRAVTHLAAIARTWHGFDIERYGVFAVDLADDGSLRPLPAGR